MRYGPLIPLLLAGQTIAAEPPIIGRLFAPASISAAGTGSAPAGAPAAPSIQRIRIDGAVVRSTGKTTVWLNGQPTTETSRGTISVHATEATLPAVKLRDVESGTSAHAKVGEEWQPGSNHVPSVLTHIGGQGK